MEVEDTPSVQGMTENQLHVKRRIREIVMQLNKLSPASGSTKAKRVGRGVASGWGKTCGSGHKGQKSRSGGTLSLVLKAVKCLFK